MSEILTPMEVEEVVIDPHGNHRQNVARLANSHEALRAALAAEQLEVELLREEVARLTLRAENAEAAYDQCQETAEHLGERRRDAEAALAAERTRREEDGQQIREMTACLLGDATAIARLTRELDAAEAAAARLRELAALADIFRVALESISRFGATLPATSIDVSNSGDVRDQASDAASYYAGEIARKALAHAAKGE